MVFLFSWVLGACWEEISNGVRLTKLGSDPVGRVGSGNLPVLPKLKLGGVVEGKELKMLSNRTLLLDEL